MLIKSNAKINLGLKIVGKREDGYHNLETIFQEISLCDWIEIEKSDVLSMTCSLENLDCGETNLCVRAVRKLELFFGKNFPVKIHLEKIVPIGAGLGGGSSNAAIILKAVAEIYQLKISLANLKKIALSLGADVPFFIEGKSAFGSGTGEILREIELPKNYFLGIVHPNFQVSTAWAYSKIKINLTDKSSFFKFVLPKFENKFWKNFLFEIENDFEPIVENEFPIILEVKKTLTDLGAIKTLLSGSGSAVFGVFENSDFAEKFKSSFSPDFSVFIAKPI